MDPRQISTKDFTYNLPEEKIALHPLQERDASKLLIYRSGELTEDSYSNIATHLPENWLLVFNNSKVINARIRFQKESGGVIEIFCLEPLELLHEYTTVMNKTGSVKWKCFIGGASKWKSGKLSKQVKINHANVTVDVAIIDKLADAYAVEFTWQPSAYSFAEIIESAGDIPLPPYIKRETVISDADRYQTIYASPEGSVAAPTAGLHFTGKVFKSLSEKNIASEYVTLHVGAGTFKPVKSDTMQGHEMHAEWIDVSIKTISNILNKQERVVAVGTTSLRTIETLYWLGVKTILDPAMSNLGLKQWDIYEAPLKDTSIDVSVALQSLINWMKLNGKERIFSQTQLLITPGYTFKVTKALVTNFHQPQSTLLLLVAAAVGSDWKKIYDYALEHNFRFLSYGDGNLIYIN